MKCLRHIFSDEVIRVTEAQAEAIRASDTLEPKCWQYAPKRDWRATLTRENNEATK